jgi:hypothetical protein
MSLVIFFAYHRKWSVPERCVRREGRRGGEGRGGEGRGGKGGEERRGEERRGEERRGEERNNTFRGPRAGRRVIIFIRNPNFFGQAR